MSSNTSGSPASISEAYSLSQLNSITVIDQLPLAMVHYELGTTAAYFTLSFGRTVKGGEDKKRESMLLSRGKELLLILQSRRGDEAMKRQL